MNQKWKKKDVSLAAQGHRSLPVYIVERNARDRMNKTVNKAEFLVLSVEFPNAVVILLSRKL